MSNITNQELFYAEWNECMHSFNLLSKPFQRILRSVASEQLVADGAEEVGSSDVNHRMFAMYKAAGRDWQHAIIEHVNEYANGN